MENGSVSIFLPKIKRIGNRFCQFEQECNFLSWDLTQMYQKCLTTSTTRLALSGSGCNSVVGIHEQLLKFAITTSKLEGSYVHVIFSVVLEENVRETVIKAQSVGGVLHALHLR